METSNFIYEIYSTSFWGIVKVRNQYKEAWDHTSGDGGGGSYLEGNIGYEVGYSPTTQLGFH